MTPQQFHEQLNREAAQQESEPFSRCHPSRAARHALDWELLRLRERGFTYREIGEVTGKTASTMQTQVFSACMRADRYRERRWARMCDEVLPDCWRRYRPLDPSTRPQPIVT